MKSTLRRVFDLMETPGPAVGIEIAAHRVTGAMLAWAKGRATLQGRASVLLPEGAVVPGAAALNIIDREVVIDAVRQVAQEFPNRSHRVGLVVPDNAAKVSFVSFDQVPPRSADLERLIAWQVRKAVPFRVEDAQLAYTPGGRRSDGGHEFVVALIRRDIVEEYEGVCAAAGLHAGVVDLATFNLINAALSMGPAVDGDWLLVHVAADSSTLAIVRQGTLIFLRNRPTTTASDLADLVHQSAMYYEDRLEGRRLARTVLVDSSGSPVELSAARAPIEERLGTVVEPLGEVGTQTLGLDQATLGTVAAPLGLVMRERAPAA